MMRMENKSITILLLTILLVPAAGAFQGPGDFAAEPFASPRDARAPGVNLTFSPEEEHNIASIEPNETRSANLTVGNTGAENDTMYLNLSANLHGNAGGVGKNYDGAGWKIWLGEDSVELLGQVTGNITVSVRSPETGNPDDYIDITVKVTSKLDPQMSDMAQFRVNLSFVPRFVMECVDKIHMVFYSGTDYNVEIRNIGNYKINLDLTTAGPPNWIYTLDVNYVTIPARGNVSVKLTVTPPREAMIDEVGVVAVTGRSTAVPAVKESIVTHSVVMMGPLIELSAADSEVPVLAGETVQFTISVSNLGNFTSGIDVSLSLNLSSPDWNASLETTMVTVVGGENKSVNLTVTAPVWTKAGSRLNAKVTGRYSVWNLSDDCNVTAIVKRVRAMDISSSPDVVELLPGNSSVCDLFISNNGNGDEYVRPAVPNATEGLSTTLKWQHGSVVNESDWYRLEPGFTLKCQAEVAAAAGAPAGDRMVQARLLIENGSTMALDFKVRVLQAFAAVIRTNEPVKTSAPGGTAAFDMNCVNEGNGADIMTVALSDLPSGWPEPRLLFQGAISNGTISLYPSSHCLMTILVTIPPTGTCATVELNATLRSSGGSNDSIKLSINIRMPNLVISGVQFAPTKPTPGKPVVITVWVRNSGEVPAENVTVRLYEGSNIVGTEKLERVPAGANLSVVFTWTGPWGRHTLTFVADPDNSISENTETDNQFKQVVQVGEVKGDVPGFDALVLLLALVVGGFMILRRKNT